MRQFDVYRNPIAAARPDRPLVIVLQHDRLDWSSTVIIAPLVRGVVGSDRRLMPILQASGAAYTLVPLDLTPIDRRRLRGDPIDNLEADRIAIQNVLDVVFSAAG